MLTLSLSQNAPAIFSLTMPMAAGDIPQALRSKGVGASVLLCRPPAHEFGFCCALILALGTPHCALNLSDFLGIEKGSYPYVCGAIP